MALRPATDDDYIAMFGAEPPAEWFGLVEASDWLVEGIGVIYRGVDDRWWVGFARVPGVRKAKTAHAAARRLIGMAEGRMLHAMGDPDRTCSERWIERLGFRRSDETLGGIAVWTR